MRQFSPAVCCLVAMAAFGLCDRTPRAAASEIDAPALFKSLDANKDGLVTADEAGTANRLLFARLLRTADENKDGKLTAAEFATGLTPTRAEKDTVAKQGSKLPGGDALVVLLALMDADGNGQLTASEVPARFAGVFKEFLAQADDNKDGRLDSREIGDKGPQLGLAAQMATANLRIDVQAELDKLTPKQRAAMERMGSPPRPEDMLSDPEQALLLFDRLDADGDKMVSTDEAPEGFKQLMKRGDRDGDGKLSRAEFQAMVRRMAAANSQMAPDGQMAPETQMAPASQGAAAAPRANVQQLLSRFDANGNGKIGKKEAPPRLVNNFDRLDRNGDGQLDADELEKATAAMNANQAPAGQRPRPAAGARKNPQ